MKLLKIAIVLVFVTATHVKAEGKFTTGMGYISPGEYRVNNEINPLPLGISFVPMIAWRGERLSVLGPNISYTLLKGMFSLSADLAVTGDRYKSRDIDTRDSAINGGITLRLLFLSVKHGVDVTNVYNGATTKASIGWSFRLTDSLFFTPNISKEFLSANYVNYYYGVNAQEAGVYTYYQGGKAVNDIYGVGFMYIQDERNSYIVNYSHKDFDREIYNSPTISEKSFGTMSAFWNYTF